MPSLSIAALTSWPVAAIVAVSDGGRVSPDRISHGLPRANNGLKTDNLIYDLDGWRIYLRQTPAEPCRRPLCAS